MTHFEKASYGSEMIVRRWIAPQLPDKKVLLEHLALEIETMTEEEFAPQCKIPEHRHHWTEVRLILSGELLVTVSGNQIILRPGDRLEIPSNTKHSYVVNGAESCHSIYGIKIS